MLADDVGVDVLDRDAAARRHQPAQPRRVEHGARAEELLGAETGQLLGGVRHHVDGVGDHHEAGVRCGLHEGRHQGAEHAGGRGREVEAGLPGLLLGAGRHRDDLRPGAHRDVGRPLDVGGGQELQALAEVELLGPHLRRVDVVQGDGGGDAADQAGVGERGADGAGADDGDLRGGHASSWQPAPSRTGPCGPPWPRAVSVRQRLVHSSAQPVTRAARSYRPARGGTREQWRASSLSLTTCLASGRVLGMGATAAHADDDYPWAWQGQCPIVPQQPIEEPAPRSRAPTRPAPAPGQRRPRSSSRPRRRLRVLDPVSGHLYDPRGPRPTCARHVWSINGSIGDSWGFVLRNCTSFVSWRLHERNGMAGFDNHFRGAHWGNADRLGRRRAPAGLPGRPGARHRRRRPDRRGSRRPRRLGECHRSRHRDHRGVQLRLRRRLRHPHGPGRRLPLPAPRRRRPLPPRRLRPARRVGARRARRVVDRARRRPRDPAPDRPRPTDAGGRSPRRLHPGGGTRAEPRRPRPPLGGRHLARRPGHRRYDAPGRLVLRAVGTSAPTASPALAQSRTRRPVLATVSAEGTLVTRRLTREGRWTHPDRVGRPAAWSTHSAPVLGNDATGRTWLAGGRRVAGSDLARPSSADACWPPPRAGRSLTSTRAALHHRRRRHDPAAPGQRGGAARRTNARRVAGGAVRQPSTGEWSPYASPAVGEVAGRLHVAAVDLHGAVLLRAALPGERSRLGGQSPVRTRPHPLAGAGHAQQRRGLRGRPHRGPVDPVAASGPTRLGRRRPLRADPGRLHSVTRTARAMARRNHAA